MPDQSKTPKQAGESEFVSDELTTPRNRYAAREMAALAAAWVQRIAAETPQTKSDACDFLVAALTAIADGNEPNKAFGWTQSPGRPSKQESLLYFEIKTAFQAHLRSGAGREKALEATMGDLTTIMERLEQPIESAGHGEWDGLTESNVRMITQKVRKSTRIDLPGELLTSYLKGKYEKLE